MSTCIELRHTTDLKAALNEIATWIIPGVERLDDKVWLRAGPCLIDFHQMNCARNWWATVRSFVLWCLLE